jgi:hypothetical protein
VLKSQDPLLGGDSSDSMGAGISVGFSLNGFFSFSFSTIYEQVQLA